MSNSCHQGERSLDHVPAARALRRASIYIGKVMLGAISGVALVAVVCIGVKGLLGLGISLLAGLTGGSLLLRRQTDPPVVLGYVLGMVSAEVLCLAAALIAEFIDQVFDGYQP